MGSDGCSRARRRVGSSPRRFDVTTETIRRDLSDLQDPTPLRRVHGGAVPWDTQGFEPLLAVRNDQQVAEKRRIARLAVQESCPTPARSSSTRAAPSTPLAEAAAPGTPLQVVTNSLLTAQVAGRDHEAVDVVVLGGTLRKNTLAMVDADDGGHASSR